MTEFVVGVDHSKASEAALRWAAREAELHDASLRVVLAWGYLDQYRGLDRFEPHYDGREAKRSLETLVATTLSADQAKAAELAVVDGFAADELLAESATADLLVVGATGRHGFLGLRLGSVSARCVDRATCSVAVVRTRAEGRELVDDRGTIVVGVDGPNSRAALQWAVAEARVRSTHLRALHAWQPMPVGATPYTAGLDFEAFERAGTGHLQATIDDVDTSGLTDPVELVSVAGSPSQTLIDASRSADLVVVGSRGSGGFAGLLVGSVAHQVTIHAAGTVVVVRSRHRCKDPQA